MFYENRLRKQRAIWIRNQQKYTMEPKFFLKSKYNFYANAIICLYIVCFLFLNEEALKPRRTPDKEVWPNPISVSMDD